MAKKKSQKTHFYKERYGAGRKSLSLAFKKQLEEIKAGRVPEKYLRMVPLIPGNRILEIGSAEGVLSLSLAREKEKVYAVEYTPARYNAALELRTQWNSLGIDTSRCELILGDIFQNFDLLKNVDTVVADRVIYYFGDQLDTLFKVLAENVENVVLGGNGSRAASFLESGDGRELGRFAKYTTRDGMVEILAQYGYSIEKVVDEHHAIVVAKRGRTS